MDKKKCFVIYEFEYEDQMKDLIEFVEESTWRPWVNVKLRKLTPRLLEKLKKAIGNNG